MERRSKKYRYGWFVASWALFALLLGALLYGAMLERDVRQSVLDRSLGNVIVAAVLADSVDALQSEALCRSIEQMPGVISIRNILPSQAINEFVSAIGHKPIMEIALPRSIEICIMGDLGVADRLQVRLMGDKRVREVVYDRDSIASRADVENGLSSIILYISIGVAFVALLLITILNGVWASREASSVIFSRVFVAAVVGGVIAALLLVSADQYLRMFANVSWLSAEEDTLLVASLQVCMSGVLGLVLGYLLKQVSRR